MLLTAPASCGAHPQPAAAPPQERCTLPLETILRVPDGARKPRPLILALHGATQTGAGLQAYSGLTRAARDVVVAYPSTPHADGFWRVSDVPRLLRLQRAIARCTPDHHHHGGGLLQRRPARQRARLPRRAPDRRRRARSRPATATSAPAGRHRFAAEIRWHGCDVTLIRGEGDTHGWPALTGANRRIVAFATG